MSGNEPPEIEAVILNVAEVLNQLGTFWAEVKVGAERANVTLAAKDGRGWHVGQTVMLSAGCLFPSVSALLSAMDREFDKHGEFRQIDTVQEMAISYLPNAECTKLRAWMLTEIFRQMAQYDLACWPRNIRPWRRGLPSNMPPEDAFDLSSRIHAYHIQFGLNRQPPMAKYAAASDKARQGAREAVAPDNARRGREARERKRAAVEFLQRLRQNGDTRSRTAIYHAYRSDCERRGLESVSQSSFYGYTKDID
tara:strand:+ start:296 stop:1051 length:756 start_codon:yes stop_codon:yes gene_type:complete